MIRCEFTCSCYEPPFYEKVIVKADNFDEGWDKAKRKAARKHKAKVKDVAITSSHWTEIEE